MTGILIPQQIFVGDTARFLYPLSEHDYQIFVSRGFVPDIPIPLTALVQNDVMTIRRIQLVKQDVSYYLAITFVPWETGIIRFPSLPFLPLKLQIPPVSVSSLLQTGQYTSLQPSKPPLLLPGTDFLLYGAAIIGFSFVLLFTAGVHFILQKLRKKTSGTAKKRLAALRKQLKKLYKELRSIQKALPYSDGIVPYSLIIETSHEKTKKAIEQWYGNIDHCLRTYLQALCTDTAIAGLKKNDHYFFSATYTELIRILTNLFTQSPEISKRFSAFYTLLERQRFAGSVSDLLCNYRASAQTMLKQLPIVIKKAEAEYAALVKKQKSSGED